MSSELLVIEPSGSSSMLGPLFALEIFLARPHRWDDSFLDKTFDGIRILPNSRLTTVLSAWTKERGFRFSTIGTDEPLNEQVDAVLLFDDDASTAMRSFLEALGIQTITIDLESGSLTGMARRLENDTPLAVSPPSHANEDREDGRRYN